MFIRELTSDPKLRDIYKACSGNKKKQEFRQKWAKKEYDQYLERQEHVKTVEKQDFSRYRVLSLGRIAWKEGGGDMGMRAALRYGLKCSLLGPPWIRMDEWTDQPKFAYVEEGWEETFKERWSQVKVNTSIWGVNRAAAAQHQGPREELSTATAGTGGTTTPRAGTFVAPEPPSPSTPLTSPPPAKRARLDDGKGDEANDGDKHQEQTGKAGQQTTPSKTGDSKDGQKPADEKGGQASGAEPNGKPGGDQPQKERAHENVLNH